MKERLKGRKRAAAELKPAVGVLPWRRTHTDLPEPGGERRRDMRETGVEGREQGAESWQFQIRVWVK